ncbi:MAG: CDP-alcohol phosphatidyltransferase family protein [Bacilli bacterium]
MFIGKYNKSVIITYVGVLTALIGMNFAIHNNITQAMMCLAIAGICDLFDGKVARMCKRTKEEISFGIQIDSLADMVGFVVFPVIIGYGLGLNEWYHILGYGLLVLAGITRLGFFNISVEDDTPVKFYSGLPVTSTSIIIPASWLIASLLKNQNYSIIYIVTIYLIALLFVLNIKVFKMKGIAYPIITIVAIIYLIVMFVLGI